MYITLSFVLYSISQNMFTCLSKLTCTLGFVLHIEQVQTVQTEMMGHSK